MPPQLNGGKLGGVAAMQITDAMTLRDGGTTCVTVEDDGLVVYVTAEHARRRFPLFPRFVFTSSARFGRDRRLIPGGRTERRYVSAIARGAVGHLGLDQVRDFLAGRSPNPGHHHWLYVLNFLDILQRIRLRSVLSEPSPHG
jgi:hypothetical protein